MRRPLTQENTRQTQIAAPGLLDEVFWPFALAFAHLQFSLGMYFRVMRAAHPDDDPYLRPWKFLREATWLLLLVLVFLQYYFMDVQAAIAALPVLEVRA